MNNNTQVSGPAHTTTEIKTWALRTASAAALAAVIGAPALASWHGLTHFGTMIGLTGGWSALVPLSLDAAAFYAALLALRATLTSDSATWPRTLTVAYALTSAGFNAYAASTSAAAWFYALMSVSAVILWDTTLRALRRDQLRALGYIQGATARYRPLRWFLAPSETHEAWKTGVLEDIADPHAALAVVRGNAVSTTDTTPSDGDSPTVLPESTTALAIAHTPCELPVGATRWGSKADAARAAFDAVGRHDVPAAIKWLAQRGVSIDRSYCYDVLRRTTAAPSLRAVGGQR